MKKRMNKVISLALCLLMLIYPVLSGTPGWADEAKAEAAAWKYDFGSESSPLMAGYIRVHNNLVYSSELGYGLDASTGSNGFRDRGSAANDLYRDFLMVAGRTFMADVPNGQYDVTVYSGDPLAGTSTVKTEVTIEGASQGTLSSKAAVTSGTYRVTVSDGQMNILFGNTAFVSGVEIVRVVPAAPPAPAGFAMTGMSNVPGSEQVTLTWESVTGAVYYDLYRATVSDATYVAYGKVARLKDTTSYTDTGVSVGHTYGYKVTSTNAAGMESEAAGPVTVELAMAGTPPAAPTGLIATVLGAQTVKLQWTATEAASGYKIFRSSSASGGFTEIGSVQSGTTTEYTDASGDTSSIHYYQVVAYNPAGHSAPSNTASSTVYVPPVPLPETGAIQLDFGPGALADGYIRVRAETPYTKELKYGFAEPSKVTSGDRGTSDPLRSDYVSPADTSFAIDLPNGDYTVTLISGDAAAGSQTAIKAETIQKVQLTDKTAGQYLEMSFEIALVDGQLNLEFSGSAPRINSLVITPKPNRVPGEIPTIYVAGDSTVQTYDEYWKPEAGWGQMIPRFFSDNVTFKNHAIGGRSSKSFIVEGRLDEVLRLIKPGDYFFVQFGHNDATISVPERYASVPDYKNYLKTYVNGARQRGATPVLVTPMGRRSFNADTGKFNVSFPEYVAGMKEVAAELDVKLVDLSALSIAYYDSIGPEASKSVFLHVEPGIYNAWPNGSADDTHFQEYGAIQIARLLSGGVKGLNLPISAFVKDAELPPAVPAKPMNLSAGSISNAGAVLKWDAVNTAEIYKIYRKLSTDAEYTLAGTSTVPTFSIGGMREGLTYQVYVVAVNGRGESIPSDPVMIKTKAAQYRYDFGPAGSPVAAGYTEVNLSTLYTPEKGYGIRDSAGMITRDRGASGTDLTRDWLGYFNAFWDFLVDVPNGSYAVKLYIGDMSGTGRTDVKIEGTSYGTVSAGRNSVVEKAINTVQVKDGQLTFSFGGATGIVNGLEITPILQSPTNLKVDSMQLELDQPVVKLSWSAAADAAQYKVYRKSEGASKPELLGSASSTAFSDHTADVGVAYEYTVTSVDASGFETVPSLPLQLSTLDPTKPAPATPTGLRASGMEKKAVTLTWNGVPEARTYNIYRADKADGSYELIGKTRATSYTDTAVLTTIPYYYKVSSVNAGGISAKSETLVTEAITKLVRQMEALDRAPVAIQTGAGVYIGWRMLGLDPDSIAFNLYRDGVKLNTNPIQGSTNFVDAGGTVSSKYKIYAVLNGVETPATGTFSVWQQQYKSIPLQKPADALTKDGQPYTYNAGDASVGDLDGDGTYEIVMLWNPSNAKDNSQAGYTGIVYMDAYKLDGTRLWRINLGPNIRAGAHYTPFMVYDLDGDGKAEIAFKTADGTVDGVGSVIGKADADYRNSSGYVLLGDEYLTVFEGLTGKALSTVNYDPPRGDVSLWGDSYGNRVDRFLAAVAYLDGERPSLVFSRGYYTRTVLAAYNFRDGQLSQVWRFDTNDEGNAAYYGQGNHNLSVGDVDGDGKDEINFGAMAIDDDGTGLYSTGLGHGDAQHFGDLDPSRPGLEQFDVHEHTDSPYGMEMRDAATGTILWGVYTGIDTGRGMAADIDPNYLGAEFWSATITNAQHIQLTGLHNTKGEKISDMIPSSTNFGIWWDGDLLRELQDYNRIDKWDYVNHTTVNLLTATGAASNNSTKANPMLQADLFGDWREEVIWRSEDSSEMRIYSTVDPTEYRLRTLMHDPNYRLGIAWQNVAYNQPPHPSYYLGVGMTAPSAPSIYLASAVLSQTQATLSGTSPVFKGQEFTVTYGLSNVNVGGAAPAQNAVYAQDITISFDPEAVEFVNATVLRTDIQIVSKNVSVTNGTLRLLLASSGPESAIQTDGPLVNLKWKAKTGTSAHQTELAVTQALLANGSMEMREAAGDVLPLAFTVDVSLLDQAIHEAQQLYDNAVEGLAPGQYYPGSKARMLPVLNAAIAVQADPSATVNEVANAYVALTKGVRQFYAAAGDFNPKDKPGTDITELGFIAAHYGMKAADSGWDDVEFADINKDGIIRVEDLIIVAKKILNL
ncbi:fibronectin type III domain-containing protein [Gorillibacterium sp. sgz5001074]|uniref:rhamnogalacturonan lyase family protein n=1 Tax=Gorillibacterium sp. sgz5001074 TaxID=3446695 RepID=UPI003F677672